MSFISKVDIVNGATILASFWRRIIDALDGTTATDIKITGELQLDQDKLIINNVAVQATADEINGLAGRTAGTVDAEKPIVAGVDKDLDYLRVETLSVANLITDIPMNPIGSQLYLHANFK